jgi:hypothetical protein
MKLKNSIISSRGRQTLNEKQIFREFDRKDSIHLRRILGEISYYQAKKEIQQQHDLKYRRRTILFVIGCIIVVFIGLVLIQELIRLEGVF